MTFVMQTTKAVNLMINYTLYSEMRALVYTITWMYICCFMLVYSDFQFTDFAVSRLITDNWWTDRAP